MRVAGKVAKEISSQHSHDFEASVWITSAQAIGILEWSHDHAMKLLHDKAERRGTPQSGYLWRREQVEKIAIENPPPVPRSVRGAAAAARHLWPAGSQTRERKCLRCKAVFTSQHFGVRMCDPCRTGNRGLPVCAVGGGDGRKRRK